MSSNSNGCCYGENGCCLSKQEKKQIVIDFLFLDLSVCQRCQGAESNLEGAVDEVSNVLKSAGYEIVVNKVNISSMELALKYEFISSPTIRINGIDIDMDVNESNCNDCGDLCGGSVDCRVWMHEGIEYSEPPKAMIINAILKAIYAAHKVIPKSKKEYVLSPNLKAFFDGVESKKES